MVPLKAMTFGLDLDAVFAPFRRRLRLNDPAALSAHLALLTYIGRDQSSVLDSAWHCGCGDVRKEPRTNKCRCLQHNTFRCVTVHTHRLLPFAVSKPRQHTWNGVEQYGRHNNGQCQNLGYQATWPTR